MEEKFMPDEESYALSEIADDSARSGFAVADIRADITSRNVSYCSMQAVDHKTKCALFNAIGKPQKVADMINKTISLAHIYIEAINIQDQNTGEIISVPRIVLIDDHENGYQGVSMGLYESVKRIIHMFGEPEEWKKPLKVQITQVRTKRGITYNLEAVFDG